jgi:hypothetical protein
MASMQGGYEIKNDLIYQRELFNNEKYNPSEVLSYFIPNYINKIP